MSDWFLGRYHLSAHLDSKNSGVLIINLIGDGSKDVSALTLFTPSLITLPLFHSLDGWTSRADKLEKINVWSCRRSTRPFRRVTTTVEHDGMKSIPTYGPQLRFDTMIMNNDRGHLYEYRKTSAAHQIAGGFTAINQI